MTQDRAGEVYEWLDNRMVFVVLRLEYVDKLGDKKWECLVLDQDQLIDSDERLFQTFSELWFSNSNFSHRMKRL